MQRSSTEFKDTQNKLISFDIEGYFQSAKFITDDLLFIKYYKYYIGGNNYSSPVFYLLNLQTTDLDLLNTTKDSTAELCSGIDYLNKNTSVNILDKYEVIASSNKLCICDKHKEKIFLSKMLTEPIHSLHIFTYTRIIETSYLLAINSQGITLYDLNSLNQIKQIRGISALAVLSNGNLFCFQKSWKDNETNKLLIIDPITDERLATKELSYRHQTIDSCVILPTGHIAYQFSTNLYICNPLNLETIDTINLNGLVKCMMVSNDGRLIFIKQSKMYILELAVVKEHQATIKNLLQDIGHFSSGVSQIVMDYSFFQKSKVESTPTALSQPKFSAM